MELKRASVAGSTPGGNLLIVPYGIETTKWRTQKYQDRFF